MFLTKSGSVHSSHIPLGSSIIRIIANRTVCKYGCVLEWHFLLVRIGIGVSTVYIIHEVTGTIIIVCIWESAGHPGVTAKLIVQAIKINV